MAKDPAVLFYTGDFLIGVSDMPFLERGYYITLLCLQHQKGHLSEETICFSLGLGSVSEIPTVIKKFEVDETGKYYQHRMDEETEKRATYTESRRNNGKKGGRPPNKDDIPQNQEPQNENHMENHMGTHMGNGNEDIDTCVLRDVKEGVQGEKKPANIFLDFSQGNKELYAALVEFERMRNRIKAPMTERAKVLLVGKLSSLSNTAAGMTELLNEAILGCWKSVYLPTEKKSSKGGEWKTSNPFLEMLEERQKT